MYIFKDLFSGDELLSDTFAMKLLDGIVYEVKGKLTTESTDISDNMIGGNASAEGGDEGGADATSVTGVDIVLIHHLVEFPQEKKLYQAHIKEYMKKIKAHLTDNNAAELDVFMKNIQPFIKKVLGEFKEYQFFCGESMNPDSQLVLMRWDEETPYLYYFKHGLDKEKM